MSSELSLTKCDGFAWTFRPGTGDRVGPGPHEHGIWRLARSFGEPHSAFIDIGAHVGHYTLRLARAFTKVIAIEPNPAALHALRRNLHLNEVGNVDIYPVAAHRSRERLRLWDPFNETAGPCTRTLAVDEPATMPIDCRIAAMHSSEDGYGVFLGEVEAIPIDLIACRSKDRIRLVKIDVEGHEGQALAGAAETIRDHRPAIMIEIHDSMYGERIRDEVVEQLSRHGYVWCDFSLYQKSRVLHSDVCPYIYAEPVGMGRMQEFLDFARKVNENAVSRRSTVL